MVASTAPTLSPALQALADEVADLPVQLATVPDEGRNDPCGMCPEPRHGGPEEPYAAQAYIRRPWGSDWVRDPACGLHLRSAVRWEIQYRRADVVLVDLIEVA